MIFTLTLNPALDRFLYVDKLIQDDTVRVNKIKDYPAGKGIDVSRVINELKGHTVAITIVGGNNGNRLLQMLDEEGVVYTNVIVEEETRMNVLIQEKTKQYRMSMKGPNVKKIDQEKIIKTIDMLIRKGDTVVLTGTPPRGYKDTVYKDLIERLNGKDILTYLDSDKDAFKYGVEASPTGIKPNKFEMERLLNKELSSIDSYKKACVEIEKKYNVREILLTLGSEGALCYIDSEFYSISIPEVKVKSAVGAGDSFLAGFILGKESDFSIEESLTLAAAASTATVTTPGTELCKIEKVLELKEKITVKKI